MADGKNANSARVETHLAPAPTGLGKNPPGRLLSSSWLTPQSGSGEGKDQPGLPGEYPCGGEWLFHYVKRGSDQRPGWDEMGRAPGEISPGARHVPSISSSRWTCQLRWCATLARIPAGFAQNPSDRPASSRAAKQPATRSVSIWTTQVPMRCLRRNHIRTSVDRGCTTRARPTYPHDEPGRANRGSDSARASPLTVVASRGRSPAVPLSCCTRPSITSRMCS
jgi:hypothetical protein